MNKLQAKCAALNAAHSYIRHIVPAILKALEPFKGQPVFTAEGQFRANVKKTLPVLENRHDLRAHFNHQTYLGLYVNASVTVDGITTYMKPHMVYIAKHGITLTELYDFTPEQWRTDYTPEEITAAREELRQAERAVERARNKTTHFGTFDA